MAGRQSNIHGSHFSPASSVIKSGFEGRARTTSLKRSHQRSKRVIACSRQLTHCSHTSRQSTITSMKVLALCAILLLTSRAVAADCSTSKPFTTDGTQRFESVLKDPAGLPIPGLGLELLKGGSAVREFRADNDGKFDLGPLPAGKYRLRVVSQPFCAPKIYCRGDICTASQALRLNEKKAKPVIVQ